MPDSPVGQSVARQETDHRASAPNLSENDGTVGYARTTQIRVTQESSKLGYKPYTFGALHIDHV